MTISNMIQEHRELPSLMVHSHPVDVNIRLENRGSMFSLVFQIGAMGPYRKYINLTADDVNNLNQNFQVALMQVITDTRDGIFSFSKDMLQKTILPLAEVGHSVYVALFGGSDDSDDISLFLNEYISTQQKNQLTIEIVSEDFFIPWELIYPDKIDKSLEFEKFWGMKHIIYRRIPKDFKGGANYILPEIKVRKSPVVGLLTYLDLRAVANIELPFLQFYSENSQLQLTHLPPLEQNNKIQGFEILRSFLSKSFHVLHLACHTLVDWENNQNSSILVSDKFAIRILDFKAYDLSIGGNPLIFMNACDTGNRNVLNAATFVSFFLSQNARGVIATESEVPDGFAAHFSKALYQGLLKGEALGACLLDIRQRFLKSEGDPAGLAYSLYAHPTIRFCR